MSTEIIFLSESQKLKNGEQFGHLSGNVRVVTWHDNRTIIDDPHMSHR
jgi:hypothetical protein